MYNGLAIAVALALLSACASTPVGPHSATVVTAKGVQVGTGVTGVSDSFTFEERVFVYAATIWDAKTSLGTKAFEVRWFNGDKLINKQVRNMIVDGPTWNVYFYAPAITLGAGYCRVELYADNVLLGTRQFQVKER